MDFEKLTAHALGLARHLFKDQGFIHAFALLDRGANLGMYQIAEDASTTDAAARLKKVIKNNKIPGYAAIYEVILSGSAEEESMIEKGARALDHVTPSKPVSLSDIADISAQDLPSKAVFITLATRDGKRKTLLLPVTEERELGPEEDVTDELHSPFAEAYDSPPLKPRL